MLQGNILGFFKKFCFQFVLELKVLEFWFQITVVKFSVVKQKL